MIDERPVAQKEVFVFLNYYYNLEQVIENVKQL